MISISAKNIDFYYGDFHAIKNVSMEIEANSVTAFIGPSGCGKSTFLRLLNRMNDLIDHTRLEGQILINNEDIYGKDVQVDELRKKVGMVFQKPNPFPMSVYDNIAFGPRTHGVSSRVKPGFHVAKSVKLENLDKTPTLGEITGVLNQYYMNLQPK